MDVDARAVIIRGLGFGDEGKGTMVDYVTAESENAEVVRDGGGYQAAHFVVSKDGRWYCAGQTGAGMFNPGVRAFVSKNVFIEPANILLDHMALQKIGIDDCMKRLSVDSRCAIATPLHQMIGRMLEVSRGKNRHGSTGMGIGQAVNDRKVKGDEMVVLGDLNNEAILEQKITALFSEKFGQAEALIRNNPDNDELIKLYQYFQRILSLDKLMNSYRSFAFSYPSSIVDGEEYFAELLESQKTIVFEGAQGALLDFDLGFKPYVTKTRTTFQTAEDLIASRVPRSKIERVGVIRAYSTRHGAGPFVTENKVLSWMIPEMHNSTNLWQGKFRVGWFDLLAARYGILLNKGADSVALTNLDRLSVFNKIRVCVSYEYFGDNENELSEYFEWEHAGRKIRVTGFKKPKQATNERISKILFECKPLDYEIFSGWKTSIENAKNASDLPKEAINYINFLQSEEGLGEQISIVSVGPTSENKIKYNPS